MKAVYGDDAPSHDVVKHWSCVYQWERSEFLGTNCLPLIMPPSKLMPPFRGSSCNSAPTSPGGLDQCGVCGKNIHDHLSRGMWFPTMWYLPSVSSDEPVQPPFKLRNPKWCSVSSLTLIEYSRDLQRLWSDRAYAQAGLSLCWSHIPHCWKSHVAAHLYMGKVSSKNGSSAQQLFWQCIKTIRTTFLIENLHRTKHGFITMIWRQKLSLSDGNIMTRHLWKSLYGQTPVEDIRMQLNTSHVEICSILCVQFVLCMGYPFMK